MEGVRKHLFIFNFNLYDIMELKKFIAKTFLTIFLPIVGLLIVYEYCYRQMPNPYRLKYTYLKQHAADVEALILGSSHTYFGIDPAALAVPAFNAANVSQDFRYDFYIFDKYRDLLTNLKYLILPVSYFSLWSDMEKGQEDWRIRKYQIYMGEHRYPIYNFRYNFEFTQIGNKELLLYYLRRKTEGDCTPLGMGTSYAKKDRKENWKSTGETAAGRHTVWGGKVDSEIRARRLENNIHYITSIIGGCRERNIKVLIVTMPAYRSYCENLNMDQLNQMYAVINKVVLSTGCSYLDLLKDSRFEDDDFFDADHLNECGARKASAILNDYLVK